MRPPRLLPLLAAASLAASVAAVAGCSSSPSTPQAPHGMPSDAAGLTAMLATSVAHITSARITLDIDLAGQTLTGGGAEKLSAGRLTALDLTEQLPAGVGSVRVVRVGDTTYAKLPASLNRSGEPWLLVTRSSSNALVRQLAPSLDSSVSAVSLGSLSVLVGAAKSVEVKGETRIGGVSTTHYAVEVEIAKLPASLPGRAELVASGQPTLPLQLYVDRSGRPVQAEPQLPVQGQSATFDVRYSNFDAPVTIAAPPAGQVGS